MKVLTNKYRRWYDELIVRARSRDLSAGCERHHVKPKSLGGDNQPDNIVRLTYREHFLAHWLLVKFTRGLARRKMQHALHNMTRQAMGTRVVAGWQYEIARKHQAEATGNMWRGVAKSADHKKRIGDAQRGKPKAPLSTEQRAAIGAFHRGRKKPPLSAEHRLKISLARRGTKMPPRSDAYRRKISQALKGKTKPPLSAAHKQQISAALRGKVKSEEHKAKIGDGRRGHYHSEASKKLMSEVKRRRNQERRAALAAVAPQ